MDVHSDYLRHSTLRAVAQSAPSDRLGEHRPTSEAVKAINESELFGHDRELRFAFDQQSKREVLTIINTETGEVLLQLPTRYALYMAETLRNQEEEKE